ncbi:MAG: bifunctional DNA primase/polymerase [Sphingomonadales bacterium]|nr:bifunctional DNA primase/polymerase [Sphingomonadales bacterium]
MTIDNHRHPEAKDWEDLRNHGYNVIPLKKGDKAPAIKWEKFKSERATDEQILRWQEHSPDANIGVVTGIISGIFVLDLDSEEALIEAEHRGLPQTPRVRTGKGQHIYFRYPPGATVNNRTGILPKTDIRGEGGYVVAPPSVHPNGTVYEWITSPDGCPLADAPEWLMKLLLEGAKPCFSAPSRVARGSRVKSANERLARAELDNELKKLSETEEGSRNHQLNIASMKLGQIVASGALDADHVKSRLYDTAISIGLEEREIHATIRSGFTKGLTGHAILDRPIIGETVAKAQKSQRMPLRGPLPRNLGTTTSSATRGRDGSYGRERTGRSMARIPSYIDCEKSLAKRVTAPSLSVDLLSSKGPRPCYGPIQRML